MPTSAGSVLIVRSLVIESPPVTPSAAGRPLHPHPDPRRCGPDHTGQAAARRRMKAGPRPEARPELAKGERDGVLFQTGTEVAAFLRFEPAVTLTVLAAGMSIDSPVCGLRPGRAERWVRSTVRRPETATFSPRVIASTSSSWRLSRTELTVEAGTSARF